ncbi:MAG: siderophore-interacting protein, partial [Actinomycetota bacterium]
DLILEYSDTIRLAARPQLGPTTGDARLSDLSPDGVGIVIGDQSAWVDFETPLSGIDDLGSATVELARAARDLYPDEPMTSLEIALSGLDGQRLHRGTVLSTRRLSDHLMAVRIGPFPEFSSLGWDQSLTVFTFTDGRSIPDDLTVEMRREMSIEDAPRGRSYTVRSFDGDGVMEIWMALHGDDPETTSTWARTRSPGDPVAVFGPRGRFKEPDDVSRAVLVADESALGAAAAVADQLDASIEVAVVGVVDHADHEFEPDLHREVTVRWLHAERGEARSDAVTSMLADVDATGTYFWAAGEYDLTRAIRRHLRRERRIPAEQVAVSAYWRPGAH